MIELNKIYNENCLITMANMSDNFVDMTLTSPPYDQIRQYNGFSFDFESVANQLFRITKMGGVIVWVVGDATINGNETGTSFKQALYFKEIGFKLYDTMIYQKMNPPPKNHPRYEQSFEYMFIFSKDKPKTFNPILEDCKCAGLVNKGTMRNEGKDDLSKKHGYGKLVKNQKIKSNIWSIPVGKNKDKFIHKHPAIFPEELAQNHILSWTNENDIIYDCFMGSGTVAKMAKLNNRNYIGSEISKEYCEIIEKRLQQ